MYISYSESKKKNGKMLLNVGEREKVIIAHCNCDQALGLGSDSRI